MNKVWAVLFTGAAIAWTTDLILYLFGNYKLTKIDVIVAFLITIGRCFEWAYESWMK